MCIKREVGEAAMGDASSLSPHSQHPNPKHPSSKQQQSARPSTTTVSPLSSRLTQTRTSLLLPTQITRPHSLPLHRTAHSPQHPNSPAVPGKITLPASYRPIRRSGDDGCICASRGAEARARAYHSPSVWRCRSPAAALKPVWLVSVLTARDPHLYEPCIASLLSLPSPDHSKLTR